MMACVGGQGLTQSKSSPRFWSRSRKPQISFFTRSSSKAAFEDAAAALRAAGSCQSREEDGSTLPRGLVPSLDSASVASEPLLAPYKSMPERSSEASDQTLSMFEHRSSCSSSPDLDTRLASPMPRLNDHSPHSFRVPEPPHPVPGAVSPQSASRLPPHCQPCNAGVLLSPGQAPMTVSTPSVPHCNTQEHTPAEHPPAGIDSSIRCPSASHPARPSSTSSRRIFYRVSRLGEAPSSTSTGVGPSRQQIARCATTTTCAAPVAHHLQDQYRQLYTASGDCSRSSTRAGTATLALAGSEGAGVCPAATAGCSPTNAHDCRPGSPAQAQIPNAGFSALFSLSRKPSQRTQNPCFPMPSVRVQPCSSSAPQGSTQGSTQGVFLASQRRLAELSECGSGATSPARSLVGIPVPRSRTTTAGASASPARSWSCDLSQDCARGVPGWPLGLKKDAEGPPGPGEDGEGGLGKQDNGQGPQHRRGCSLVFNPAGACAAWSLEDWQRIVAAAEAGLRAGEAFGISHAEAQATRALLRTLQQGHQDPGVSHRSSWDQSTSTSDLAMLCATDSDRSEANTSHRSTQEQSPRPRDAQEGVLGTSQSQSRCPLRGHSMTPAGPLACPYLNAHPSAHDSVPVDQVSEPAPDCLLAEAFPRHPLLAADSSTGDLTSAALAHAGETQGGARLHVMEAVVQAHEMLLCGEANGVSSACWFLLEQCLAESGASMGFIASLRHHPDESPFLKTHAVTNIGWTPELRQWYDENQEAGVVFTNMDTLFGAVVRTKAVVLSNTPERDARSSGVPPGHPAITSFLGIPLLQGEELVGVCALANLKQVGDAPTCFEMELVQELQPLIRVASLAVARAVSQAELADDRTDGDSVADCLEVDSMLA